MDGGDHEDSSFGKLSRKGRTARGRRNRGLLHYSRKPIFKGSAVKTTKDKTSIDWLIGLGEAHSRKGGGTIRTEEIRNFDKTDESSQRN